MSPSDQRRLALHLEFCNTSPAFPMSKADPRLCTTPTVKRGYYVPALTIFVSLHPDTYMYHTTHNTIGRTATIIASNLWVRRPRRASHDPLLVCAPRHHVTNDHSSILHTCPRTCLLTLKQLVRLYVIATRLGTFTRVPVYCRDHAEFTLASRTSLCAHITLQSDSPSASSRRPHNGARFHSSHSDTPARKPHSTVHF